MSIKNIAYLGFSEELILQLLDHEYFHLNHVVSQPGRISSTMIKLLAVSNVPCSFVSNKQQLLDMQNELMQSDAILIHCFGIIVPERIYRSMLCFNIHTGDLSDNRGPYPLVWDILQGKKKSVSILHQLGDNVDTGKVISRFEVCIDDTDNLESLVKKLDMGLSIHLDRLRQYDEAVDYLEITDGVYRKKVDPDLVTIKDTDSLFEVSRKIRSQSRYGGAFLKHNGFVYRVSSVEQAIHSEK